MDPQDNNLGFLLNKATRLIKWEFDKLLVEYKLTTPQWSVLIDLAKQNKYCKKQSSPADIAARLNVDRPTMSGIISRLITKGFLTTKANPLDRRYQIVALTESAEELIPKLEALSNRVIASATEGLSADEVSDLKLYLTKVINNFSN